MLIFVGYWKELFDFAANKTRCNPHPRDPRVAPRPEQHVGAGEYPGYEPDEPNKLVLFRGNGAGCKGRGRSGNSELG